MALNSLVRKASPPSAGSRQFVRLGEALRLTIPGDATVPFIRAIQQAELGPPRDNGRSRLGDLMIDREEVRAWWRCRQKTEPQWLTLRQFASALEIKNEVVTQLLKARLIETHVLQCGRRKAQMVSQNDVESFCSSYSKLKTLAHAHGVPARRAYEWAVEHQLSVVTGPLVDGRRQYFVKLPVELKAPLAATPLRRNGV